MTKKGKKALIISGSVVGGLIALFLILYATLAVIGLCMYRENRSLRKEEFKIPELNRGFTPQGVTYIGDGNYLVTGYHAKTNETLLYSVNGKNYSRIKIGDSDGKTLKGHGGGVTSCGNAVYVTNYNKLVIYLLTDLIKADGERVTPVGELTVPFDAAFCFVEDNLLYTGEFYRKGNYETDDSHRINTNCGDYNPAIVACYELENDGMPKGGAQAFPVSAISVTKLVQGIAVSNGVYMLSRSWGLTNSKLEYYSEPYLQGEINLTVGEKSGSVPLYVLDSSNKFRTVTLPSFSEDLTVVGDRVTVMNEAACDKYVIGKLFSANKAYSYPIFGR